MPANPRQEANPAHGADLRGAKVPAADADVANGDGLHLKHAEFE
jgi:hypothetical protein